MNIWKRIDDATVVLKVPGGMLVQTEVFAESGLGISVSVSTVFVPDTSATEEWIEQRAGDCVQMKEQERFNNQAGAISSLGSLFGGLGK